MSKSDPIQFLQSQKAAIDEKISEISGRCTVLRERHRDLESEKAGLMETPVTVDDFIDCVCGAIRKKKEFYPIQLVRNLKDDAYRANIIGNPSFKNVTHETLLANAAGSALAELVNPKSASLAALFYILNDLIIEGFKTALKEGLQSGKGMNTLGSNPFANGKPMKETAARLAEIDSELAQIDAEIEELTQSAGLFGVSI